MSGKTISIPIRPGHYFVGDPAMVVSRKHWKTSTPILNQSGNVAGRQFSDRKRSAIACVTAPAPFSIGARGAIKSEAGHVAWLFMDSLAVVPKHLWQSDIDPSWLAQWGYFITVEHETALSRSANQIMLGGELLNKETWLSRPSRFRSQSWGTKGPQPLVAWLVGKTTAQLIELTTNHRETKDNRKAALRELDDRLKSVWWAFQKGAPGPWPVTWPNEWLRCGAFDISTFDAAWLKADAVERQSETKST
jgi:hypothetical protein